MRQNNPSFLVEMHSLGSMPKGAGLAEIQRFE
jgi:hypothetical protein